MITSKLILLDIKKIHLNWFIYFSIILSVIPAYGIAYAIKNLHGPFSIYHITSFYSLFGTILCVIISMRLFTDDLYNEVHTLLYSNKDNRKKYLISKVIGSIYIGILFGITCVFVIFTSVEYLNINVNNSIYIKSIINYVMFSSFYSILFFFISTFYRKVTFLFVIAILSISFLPNLISTILDSNLFSDKINNVIENLPFYFLPLMIGSHNFSNTQYILTLLSILLVFYLAIKSLLRQDY